MPGKNNKKKRKEKKRKAENDKEVVSNKLKRARTKKVEAETETESPGSEEQFSTEKNAMFFFPEEFFTTSSQTEESQLESFPERVFNKDPIIKGDRISNGERCDSHLGSAVRAEFLRRRNPIRKQAASLAAELLKK